MGEPKKHTLGTGEMVYKGTIIGALVTVPSLVAFMLGWHFGNDIIVGAITGGIVHVVALVASFKVAKKISRHTPKED